MPMLCRAFLGARDEHASKTVPAVLVRLGPVVGEGLDSRVRRLEGYFYGRRGVVKVQRKHGSGKAEEKAMRRMVDDVTLLCSLQHPNIMSVVPLTLATGSGDPRPGYFMEEGVSASAFADRLAETLGTAEASTSAKLGLRILELLVPALAYLKQRKVVHADVKPGNMIVFPDRTSQQWWLPARRWSPEACSVQLTDFGMAGKFGAWSDKGGTPEYQYPMFQHSFHRPVLLDFEFDTWALGISAIELCGEELEKERAEVLRWLLVKLCSAPLIEQVIWREVFLPGFDKLPESSCMRLVASMMATDRTDLQKYGSLLRALRGLDRPILGWLLAEVETVEFLVLVEEHRLEIPLSCRMLLTPIEERLTFLLDTWCSGTGVFIHEGRTYSHHNLHELLQVAEGKVSVALTLWHGGTDAKLISARGQGRQRFRTVARRRSGRQEVKDKACNLSDSDIMPLPLHERFSSRRRRALGLEQSFDVRMPVWVFPDARGPQGLQPIASMRDVTQELCHAASPRFQGTTLQGFPSSPTLPFPVRPDSHEEVTNSHVPCLLPSSLPPPMEPHISSAASEPAGSESLGALTVHLHFREIGTFRSSFSVRSLSWESLDCWIQAMASECNWSNFSLTFVKSEPEGHVPIPAGVTFDEGCMRTLLFAGSQPQLWRIQAEPAKLGCFGCRD
ncbi:mlkA [Symbiodinium sp. CCMP2592]|nr:mlkA [Symbiodinium sp. CCMP2592]